MKFFTLQSILDEIKKLNLNVQKWDIDLMNHKSELKDIHDDHLTNLF